MFETLVPSRIRRTIFEYLLAHPADRFYLRGVAKELGLSVSPLRRELKRLECAGALTVAQEGNILFYTVNTASPIFLQLKQASRQTEAPSPTAPSPIGTGQVGQPATVGAIEGVRPVRVERVEAISSLQSSSEARQAVDVEREEFHAIPVGVITAAPRASSWRMTWPKLPLLLGVASASVAFILIAAALFYLAVTNQRLASQASQAPTVRSAEVTVVLPPAASSGTMRGKRWQVIPGAMGGFSADTTNKSY